MEAATKQFKKRNAILSCLRGTVLHPSAEMVHEMLREEHPDISLATIYRNLALFRSPERGYGERKRTLRRRHPPPCPLHLHSLRRGD